MNQPTREEFEEFKQEVKEEFKHLREQLTEPMKVTRIEVASEDVLKKLDSVQEDVGVLKEEMKGARADISNLKATQSDHNAFFIEHGQRLKSIEDKQDTHTEILGQLVNLSEEHTKRFDHIDANMATKEDINGVKDNIARLETDISSIKSTQEQILALLRQKP